MTHFTTKQVRRWRRDVWREIVALGFNEKNPRVLYVGMVLAGVLGFGTDPAVLSELTGASQEFVKQALTRMRKARILSGQTLRIRWDKEGLEGAVAFGCDIMAAAQDGVDRVPNPKRSAAQKARSRTVPSKPRAARAPKAIGAFTPRTTVADAWYQATPEGRDGRSS